MRPKSTFTSLVFLFVFGFTFGQDADKDWTKLQSKDGITISFKKGECNIAANGSYTEEVYLKFANTTDQLVYVD